MRCAFIHKRGPKKNIKCNALTKHGNFCRNHTGICLDRQPYFDDFLEWFGEDNLNQFNHHKQKHMYYTFINYIKGLANMANLLEITDPTDIDLTRQQLLKQIKSNNIETVKKFCEKLEFTPQTLINNFRLTYTEHLL